MLRLRLVCTQCICLYLVMGCTIQFYAPSLPPIAPPQNANSISIGTAPFFTEYRQNLSNHIDLLLSGIYYPNDDDFISTAALGPNLWLFEKEERPGFNMSLFLQPTISVNQNSSLNWSLWGGRIGITPGYYGTTWNFSFPLSFGGGAAWNGTEGYMDYVIGLQVNRARGKSTSGFTLGVPIPVNVGGCYSNGYAIILIPLPQASFQWTYTFGSRYF